MPAHISIQAKESKKALAEISEDCKAFVSYFRSNKFNWPNDYARTHEIISRLELLKERADTTLDKINY
jgi:hypothetical protein